MEPGLALSFEITLRRGTPVDVGETGLGGRRRYVPIEGGDIGGLGLSGKIVGGSETLLLRADGVTVVEASYYIRNPDGWSALCIGRGYRTSDATFSGFRMSLLFEVDQAGPLAHLSMAAFAAEETADGKLSIYRIT